MHASQTKLNGEVILFKNFVDILLVLNALSYLSVVNLFN